MRLAVLITYHNERELLTECLESLAAQERGPDEVWIYDDASKYPARDYLGTSAGLAFPIQVVRGEAGIGPARGRNHLLAQTQADFVHFHDADDLFLAGWARCVREAVEVKDPDIVLTELKSVRNGQPYGHCFLDLLSLSEVGDLTRYALSHAILPAAGTYRRAFLEKAGGYRTDLWQSEDYEFHIRLAHAGAHYCAITDPLVLVRVRDESRSQKLSEVWKCRLQALEIVRPELGQDYAQDLSEAFAHAGSILHRLGEVDEARRAFAASLALGTPDYHGQLGLYRWSAHLFGPLAAERLAAFYRRLFPEPLRRAVRGV